LKIKRKFSSYPDISISRNNEVLAKDVHNQLKQDLSSADFYYLALNESCDITDTSQLIIYVKYLNNFSGKFYEELLTLLLLSGSSKENDLYNAVLMYVETEHLILKKIIYVTTDDAMIGTHQDFLQRLRNNLKRNSIIYYSSKRTLLQTGSMLTL